MYRIISIIYFISVVMLGFAQTSQERIVVFTDKDCYLAGERLCVRVDVTAGDEPSPSRVAYIEISDTKKMHAQCMVSLTDGQGWGEIALPESMHSGCYQLTAYTRAMQCFGGNGAFRSVIGVINAEKLSRYDNIVFMPLDSCRADDRNIRLLDKKSCSPDEIMNVAMPDGVVAAGASVSIYRAGIYNRSLNSSLVSSLPVKDSFHHVPEIEGHILRAKVEKDTNADVAEARLAIIGQSSTLYDGQKQTDGSFLFYTSGICGNVPVLLNAFDANGLPVNMKLVSPYASVLPKELPKLIVYCQEEELRQLATEARKQAAIASFRNSSQFPSDSAKLASINYMGAEPSRVYNLDEYTKMNTIKEILLEFVKGVTTRKHNGVSKLFTLDQSAKASRWPALVLLDGMPVHDIDEILSYDAHLVHYVQIYYDRFYFGSTCCQGVISFVTRKGLLSNYKLKDGEHLVSYAFPQDHPKFDNKYTSSGWWPCVKEKVMNIHAPSVPGHYMIRVQSRMKNGEIYTASESFDVR